MQMLGMLEAMPSNKQYTELEDSVNKAVQFIRYPGHCLKDGPRLLALLANLLYPDLRYLHIIRWLWIHLLHWQWTVQSFRSTKFLSDDESCSELPFYCASGGGDSWQKTDCAFVRGEKPFWLLMYKEGS